MRIPYFRLYLFGWQVMGFRIIGMCIEQNQCNKTLRLTLEDCLKDVGRVRSMRRAAEWVQRNAANVLHFNYQNLRYYYYYYIMTAKC